MYSSEVSNNGEPDFLRIFSGLVNKPFKDSYFSDFRKVLSAVPVFKNYGERSDNKNCRPVIFSNIFLTIDKLIDCNRYIFVSNIIAGLFLGPGIFY